VINFIFFISQTIKSEKGSMLVFASFIFIALTLICFSYTKLIRYKTIMVISQERQVQAFFAARGGIEDALYELKEEHAWDTGGDLDGQWQHQSGGTFYKVSGTNPATQLTHFDYPVTISVTVDNSASDGEIDIVSRSEISVSGRRFASQLKAEVIRSLSGELHIRSIQGI
jgi:hypothetical protein